MYCVLCKARYIILCLSTGSCSKKWWRDPRKRNNSGEANVAKNYCYTWIKSIIVIDTPFSRLAKNFFLWSALWSLVFFSLLLLAQEMKKKKISQTYDFPSIKSNWKLSTYFSCPRWKCFFTTTQFVKGKIRKFLQEL